MIDHWIDPSATLRHIEEWYESHPQAPNSTQRAAKYKAARLALESAPAGERFEKIESTLNLASKNQDTIVSLGEWINLSPASLYARMSHAANSSRQKRQN